LPDSLEKKNEVAQKTGHKCTFFCAGVYDRLTKEPGIISCHAGHHAEHAPNILNSSQIFALR